MLSRVQERVARLFLELPEARRFALAGGAALVLRGEVDRVTRDLDFFAPDVEDVRSAVDAFRVAAGRAGFDTAVVRSGPAFARLVVTDENGDRVLVDVGYDHRMRAVEQTPLGPALALDELGADKVLALFGRAEARDFVDVHALAQRLGTERLLELAREKDAGFDPYVLAMMMGRMDRLPRPEFEIDDAAFVDLSDFYRRWRARLVEDAVRGERG